MIDVAGTIARIGSDPRFIAFNAHCWFACSVVLAAPEHGMHDIAAVCVIAVATSSATARASRWRCCGCTCEVQGIHPRVSASLH
jgi:hypothetical protein